jgi:hypothetical protein
MIERTAALRYRPVFIAFDPKAWKGLPPPDLGFSPNDKIEAGKRALNEVFTRDGWIDLGEYIGAVGRYPTVPELAGKVVLYLPKDSATPDGTLHGTWSDVCVTAEAVERSIQTGAKLFPDGHSCPDYCRVFRLDQYQADWTFDYGVPPNPLMVDATARPPWSTQDADGDSWDCDNGDTSHGEVVHEHGTFRFPYTTIGRAIERAEGTTPHGARDPRRAGLGWTVLVKPGNYAENLTIDIPLTLKKDDTFDGTVLITGQHSRMIRSLWITFHTNDENKDGDTGLLVELRALDARVLARFEQRRNKEYKPGFTHTERMEVLGPIFDSDMTGAMLSIDITPNGHDTWRCNWEFIATWSDGGIASAHGDGLDLDEDKRHFQKTLVL